jgi:hypothetical protein
MAADRIITCTNAKGYSMSFTEQGFTPFLLAKANGIYDAENTIFSTNNTMLDGAEYQGSVMATRNITLILKDKKPFADNRDKISVLFDKGSLGTLTVEDEGHKRSIEYYVESITSTATPDVRYTTISLLCPNPHFYDPYTTKVGIMTMQSCFEFIHEFKAEGEEFSFINEELIRNIVNNSAEDNIGLTITFMSTSTTVNPSITKVETNETLKVGTETKPFELHAGDKLVISTIIGSKNVYLIHDGVSTDINEYLSYDSSFMSLNRGNNNFGLDADDGKGYLIAEIAYRYSYARA